MSRCCAVGNLQVGDRLHPGAEEKLLQVASSLTFTTVLAIVRMLAVVLSLFTAFPVFQEFRVALEDFLANSLMPPSVSDNIMEYLNQFARQASRLTAIGGAFLLVTSLLLIMTIDTAFNDIWHVTRQRPLPQRALVYWAVITLGPVVAGASLWATSFVARGSLGLVRDVPEIVSMAISFIPLVLTALGFAALFVVVPNRQ
ncbi:YihY family inner membrane protein, partial [Bacillus velezensis]|nr:YihY family inner membrane protein [Bacillus velezensis]